MDHMLHIWYIQTAGSHVCRNQHSVSARNQKRDQIHVDSYSIPALYAWANNEWYQHKPIKRVVNSGDLDNTPERQHVDSISISVMSTLPGITASNGCSSILKFIELGEPSMTSWSIFLLAGVTNIGFCHSPVYIRASASAAVSRSEKEGAGVSADRRG